ncbi:MAG: hypothetical protein AAGA44_14725 [Pseudomonadota bacterium]
MSIATLRSACATLHIFAGLLATVPLSLAQTQGMPSFQDGQLPEIIELSDSDVTRFLSTAAELEALGVEMDDDALDSLDTLMGQEKALDVLSKNGFEPEGFFQIAFSVGIAYAVIGQSAEELAEMEAGMKEMEQMKASLPPEQWEAIEASMGAAFGLMKQIRNQPESNLRLAEKYKDELAELMGE